MAGPADIRALAGDGSFGGSYELGSDAMDHIWRTGVSEVRDLIENGWAYA